MNFARGFAELWICEAMRTCGEMTTRERAGGLSLFIPFLSYFLSFFLSSFYSFQTFFADFCFWPRVCKSEMNGFVMSSLLNDEDDLSQRTGFCSVQP